MILRKNQVPDSTGKYNTGAFGKNLSGGFKTPKHFIGIALILLTTLSMLFCVVKRQLCPLKNSKM
jgi:hypothetical protein